VAAPGKTLEQIFPNIKDLFPGKPIQTDQGGQGFIIAEEKGLFKVQYEKGKGTELVRREDLQQERDSNEITYDAKTLQEIETSKKERMREKSKQKKSRCEMGGRCWALMGGIKVPGSASYMASQAFKKKHVRRSIKGNLSRGG
jgi:hypothetical protein